MLRATTACTFPTARLQNGLQFFISHLPRWLRTRRFSQPIFRPSGARRHWKNTGSRGFSTFSHTCIFFPLTLSLLVFFLLLFSSPLLSSLLFSSLPFPSLLFSSLTLPTSAFLSVHTVGILTSKRPSVMTHDPLIIGIPFSTNPDQLEMFDDV